MTHPSFRRFSWVVAGYGLAVVLWGYFLRISESGDGCGTDWPLCHGAVLPEVPELSTLVELTHRISSGIVLLLVIALAIAAFRSFPRGHALRFGAGAALLLTISESLFGAILVVFGWVADDISVGRTLIRPIHVTNTFLLIAALFLTAWWASRGVEEVPRPTRGDRRAVSEDDRLATPGDNRLPTDGWRSVILPLLGVLALAWTGAWTGLAVTAFPTDTVSDALGQYGSPEHLLIYLRVLHPLLAIVVIALLFRFAGASRRIALDTRDSGHLAVAIAVGILAGAQILAGPLTIAVGNPVALRLFHLLLADLLWIALVLAASARFEGRPGLTPG